MTEVVNLTTMEVDALMDADGGLNLTDGHARLVLTPQQSEIVARIPEMFVEATRRPFSEIELAAHKAFFSAVGQHTAPVGSGRILSCYSSTLATDIVARALPALLLGRAQSHGQLRVLAAALERRATLVARATAGSLVVGGAVLLTGATL